ncbi:MAG TPA: exodeoxyribonuclease VII small subunit [Acidobacteriota bacterium]
MASSSFEADLAELEGVVKKMEEAELSLDQALQLLERGVELFRRCHAQLEAAENKVELLLREKDKDYEAAPFPDLEESPE